jgi:translation initiation factor 2 subunit 2
MDYDELLKRAKTLLPEKGEEKQRFEVPKVKGRIQGKKTIISNMKAISDYLARPETMLFKYLLREFGTKGVKDGNFYVFTGKFGATLINEKIGKFVSEYVNCRECGKPDTKLSKQDRINFIKCMACGAKYPIQR